MKSLLTEVTIKTICISASFHHIPFSMICMNRTENQKQQHDS